MLVCIWAAVGVFGDRQGVLRRITDTARPATALALVRSMPRKHETVHGLLRELGSIDSLDTWVCVDPGDTRRLGVPTVWPEYTTYHAHMVHTDDARMREVHGDSHRWRRWRMSLVADMFGCLARVPRKYAIVVWFEDDLHPTPAFEANLRAFRASGDTMWWNRPKGQGPTSFMLRTSGIAGLRRKVDPKWDLDPVDWLLAPLPDAWKTSVFHDDGHWSTHPGHDGFGRLT